MTWAARCLDRCCGWKGVWSWLWFGSFFWDLFLFLYMFFFGGVVSDLRTSEEALLTLGGDFLILLGHIRSRSCSRFAARRIPPCLQSRLGMVGLETKNKTSWPFVSSQSFLFFQLHPIAL